MTLESWSMGIVRPVMEIHATAWVFFVPFILVTTFAVLNLFVGTIVNAMQSKVQEEQAADTAQAHDERAAMLAELGRMGGQLAQITTDVTKLRQWIEESRGAK